MPQSSGFLKYIITLHTSFSMYYLVLLSHQNTPKINISSNGKHSIGQSDFDADLSGSNECSMLLIPIIAGVFLTVWLGAFVSRMVQNRR